MAAPRQRHWISPARTGSSGQPLTKAEQTSVPPLVETGQTCAPTASRIQWKVSGGSGEPVEAIARRAPRSWRRAGGEAGLRARGQVPGARAVHGGPGARDHLELGVELGVARAAVVEHDRRADEQAGDEPVPDHPARAGVEGEAVGGAEVEVQGVVADVVEQLAAVAVHDPLGRPRRARGEEHVERVVEGEGLERGRRRRPRQGRPRLGARRPAEPQPVDDDHRGAQGGQGACELGHRRAAVVGAPAVAIAVAGDERRGAQLGEAVQRGRTAAGPARRTTRPRRCSRRPGRR